MTVRSFSIQKKIHVIWDFLSKIKNKKNLKDFIIGKSGRKFCWLARIYTSDYKEYDYEGFEMRKKITRSS